MLLGGKRTEVALLTALRDHHKAIGSSRPLWLQLAPVRVPLARAASTPVHRLTITPAS